MRSPRQPRHATRDAAPAARPGRWSRAATSVLLLVTGSVLGCAPRGEPAPRVPLARQSARVTRLASLGEALFYGRGGCTHCHRLGDEGEADVGPNLGVGPGFPEPVARRERTRGDAFGYVLRSIVDPDAFVVPSYPAGKMPRVEEPPIGLSDDEVVALATFLATRSPKTEAPLVDDARLDASVGEIEGYRAVRTRRADEKHVAELKARAHLDQAVASDGPKVWATRGCAACHGPAERADVTPPRGHEPASVLEWLASELPRRPHCADLGRPSELAALAVWLAAAPP